jgi:hypothetical protein
MGGGTVVILKSKKRTRKILKKRIEMLELEANMFDWLFVFVCLLPTFVHCHFLIQLLGRLETCVLSHR